MYGGSYPVESAATGFEIPIKVAKILIVYVNGIPILGKSRGVGHRHDR